MADQRPYPIPLAVGAGLGGLPITFSQGPFVGRTIRTATTELQKADAGRKFARKDRRPLDPPPVVQVRFFEVVHFGTPAQYEREITTYDDTLVLGLVCQVDLFPIPDELTPEGINNRDLGSTPMTGIIVNPVSTNTIPYGAFAQSGPPHQPFPLYAPAGYGRSPKLLNSVCSSLLSSTGVQESASSSAQTSDHVIAYFSNYAITESSNCTYLLAGARVASAVNMEFNSRPTLAFVFNDLAVQQEGSYTLRYRVFSIFARTTDVPGASSTTPILASCFGGVFRIWSSKSFPGLAPSTALTRRLSLYGMHVNIRTSERKKKTNKNRPSDPESGAAGSPESQASWPPNDELGASPGHSRHSGDWPGISP
ncbi:velvet factor-domain-containing protein [Dichomitus squalens]|uniref:Velvet factor-domain-containing protein n=2 Tax=Dichomitus squalens TaxID=114155 RepID=A0A4Q9PR89_9APHY|nr:velvet factor-domain-containing protein [Dichomitus squalens]TBU56886.1 velvet factor-domain-containing protein [Dichomitus squalens]